MFIEIYRTLYWERIRGSYSQRHEDLEIDRILKYKNKGFYVDIGAYHPNRFNNTKRFYNKGWNGINIEPNKINYLKFKKYRARDINLNIGIALSEENLTFFNINPPTLSTFSESRTKEYKKQGFEIISKEDIKAQRLETIFDKYVKEKEIDFISIDTEGYDMEVLKSNNWNRNQPKLICIESAIHDESDENKKQRLQEYEIFFKTIHYKKIYDNEVNFIYQSESQNYKERVLDREKQINSNKFHKKNRNLIARFIRGIKNGQAEVLETGCGHGDVSKYYLAPNCKEVIATDISKSFIEAEISEKNIKFVIENALNLSFKDNTFDIVVAVDVIEHISDDRRFIEEAIRVVKKGGVVYFTTPNRLRLTSLIRHVIGRPIRFPHTYTVDPVLGNITHVREYSYGDLNRLINSIGNFTIKSQEIKGVWFGVPSLGIGCLEPPNKILEKISWTYHVRLMKL